MNLRQQLVKVQMQRRISYCILKKTFCRYDTPQICLMIRECPYPKVKEDSFRRKK